VKISEILRAGKQRIERFGWVQGDIAVAAAGDDGPFCAATAMPCAMGAGAAIEFFKKAIDLDPKNGLGEWNDAPERTKEEVLAAYDKAIAAAEAQETP
jgi:hypothetical protein